MCRGGKAGQFLITLALLFSIALSANAFAEEKSATAQIPVVMDGTGTEEAFTVEIENKSRENPDFVTTDKDSLNLKRGETGSFYVTAIYPGNYDFNIWQEKGSDKDTDYDSTMYHAEVCVTEDNSGVMSAQAFVFKNGDAGKTPCVKFENTKHVSNKTSQTSPQTGDTIPGKGMTAAIAAAVLLAYWGMKLKREAGR